MYTLTEMENKYFKDCVLSIQKDYGSSFPVQVLYETLERIPIVLWPNGYKLPTVSSGPLFE